MNDYLETLFRYKLMILLVAVVMGGAAYFVTRKQAPQYKATSKMLVNQDPIAALPSTTPSVTDPTEFERLVSTQIDLAQIPAVATAALRATQANGTTPEQLLRNVTLSEEANADLVDVSVTAGTPQLAERLSAAYANAFVNYQSALARSQLSRDLAGVEATIRSQLGAAGRAPASVTNSPSFQGLLSLRNDLSAARAAAPKSSVVVSAAQAATQTAPKPLGNGVIALVLGLILGSGLAFVIDARDGRARSTREISEQLGLNLLARIPPPGRRLRSRPHGAVTMLTDPGSASAEAIKMLQANLEFARLHRAAQVVLFTSAVRQEGKSTTVANLAVSLAQSGHRVIVVDADVRQPTLSRLFTISKEFGLTDLALGELEPEDLGYLLAEVELDVALSAPNLRGSLQILPAGRLEGQPDRLLSSPALDRVFAALRGEADWILVDSPPMTEFYDAFLVSRHVEALIAVARLRHVQVTTLAEFGRLLASTPVPPLGFVATGAGGKRAGRHDLVGRELRARQPAVGAAPSA